MHLPVEINNIKIKNIYITFKLEGVRFLILILGFISIFNDKFYLHIKYHILLNR